MSGFAAGGIAFPNGANIAIAGQRPAGLAANGSVIWRAAPPAMFNVTVNWTPLANGTPLAVGDAVVLIWGVSFSSWYWSPGWGSLAYVAEMDQTITGAPNARLGDPVPLPTNVFAGEVYYMVAGAPSSVNTGSGQWYRVVQSP
jgi:hypothetical protein